MHRSGSRITAKYAKMQGKKVYCIPVNLDQKNNSGILDLLQEGSKLVRTPNQLISDLYSKETDKLETDIQRSLDIPKEYEEIYSALECEMSVDEIAIKINKNIGEINSILTIMEIEGYIEQIAGNIFKRKV